MQTYIKSSYIKCDVNDLFEFHLDTNNLTRITPPNIKVELLTKEFKPIESQILEIKSTKYFIPTYWKVKIETIDKPNILVDVALKSPFTFWEHRHVFLNHGNYSELKDIVVYKLPFGFVVSKDGAINACFKLAGIVTPAFAVILFHAKFEL